MHTMWKGTVSFGLVNIPIKMYAAAENKDVRFRSLHKACGTPIKYQKYCPNCETAVENSDLMKGYETETGTYIPIEEEELGQLKENSRHTVDMLDFVQLSEIDPIYFDRSYFLGPGENGEKAYALLHKALSESEKIGIATFNMHGKEHLSVIRVYQDGLLLESIHYPEEIRSQSDVPGIGQLPEVDSRELDTAIKLIDQLTAEFDPEKYKNTFRDRVLEFVQKKAEGGEITQPAQAPKRENVVDLLSALEASLNSRPEKSKAAEAKKTKAKPKTKKKKA